MSIILAIETSTELASAALWQHGSSMALEAAGVHTHSATILPLVQQLLRQAGLGLRQCDAIAFGCGPGSFTGVRTACAVAQGLAFGAELPVLPVVTLTAMAEACRSLYGATDVVPVLDARMAEAYWARYQYVDGWRTLVAPILSAPQQIRAGAGSIGCGNGFVAFAEALSTQAFGLHAKSGVMPHARYVAQLAQQQLARGQGLAPELAQPLYLRNHVAFTTSERAAGAVQGTP
jgi:tRNA threonylcarbamoyladenosine biosynthesis protein TsaB